MASIGREWTSEGEHVAEAEGKLNMKSGSSALAVTPIGDYAEPVRKIIEGAMKRADESLAGSFSGVMTGARDVEGLHPLASTGVSVAPIIEAAQNFLASLSTEQRETVSFEVDDDYHWRSWHNMHFFLMRHGLGMHDMSSEQRGRALDVLRTSMSVSGFDNARDVMRLNEHAAELTGRRDEYGEFYYWISLFGTPSATEPWGWQIDGHHLIVNCLIIGDQIVMTPDFRGSEPVVAESGAFAGTQVFVEEESTGLDLMRSLGAAQREIATISTVPPREVITTAQVDNLVLGNEGLAFSSLKKRQQDDLVELISLYTSRLRPGHAELWLDQIMTHLDDTHFAWMGGCDDDAPFYYRVTNPLILIEFDHLPGIIYDNREPSRRHVHTIVRTPNGNDYGRSVLLEHYRRHDHADPMSQHRQGTHSEEHSSSHNHQGAK